MKTGQIIKSPRWRWYEPQHVLLGGQGYFTHAWGTLYVLSGQAAADLSSMRDGALRHFANEGAHACSHGGACLPARPPACLPAPPLPVPSSPHPPHYPHAHADTTIGAWLLAFNSTHYDDRRLCETNCTATAVAVYDMPVCAGLCDAAAQLPLLHASPACSTPAVDPTGALPLREPLFRFDSKSDPAWDAAAVRQLREQRVRAAAGGAGQEQQQYDTVLPLRLREAAGRR